MSKAGVPFQVIRDKYLEDEEFRKEYEKLGEKKMGIIIKESEKKAKVLFITDKQYTVMDTFLDYMDFEDGTFIKVVEADKSIYINTCGLSVTIMSSDVDTKLINRKFNYIFVDLNLNFGNCDADALRLLIDEERLSKMNSGLYVINMFESDNVIEDLFNKFRGEEQDEDGDEFDTIVSFKDDYRDYDEEYHYNDEN